MKNKIVALIAVGLVSISGILVFAGKEEYDPSIGGGCIDLSNEQAQNMRLENDRTQKTSELLKEELAVTGSIDNIEITEEGTIITVNGTEILIHASTNIFKVESLLEVTDLEKGQMVEVYSDGEEREVLNGLKVEVLMTYQMD